MAESKLVSIDAAALPWEERYNEFLGKTLYRKNLITDPETGMEIRIVKYPAGVVNKLHTHPCAHGMYVLEGKAIVCFRCGTATTDPVRRPAAVRPRRGALLPLV